VRLSQMRKHAKSAFVGACLASAVAPASYANSEIPIKEAIYLQKVLEYCGGDSWHTQQGYRLLRRSLGEADIVAQQMDFDSVVEEIETWLLDRQGAAFSVWCESKTASARKFFIDQWSNKMDSDLDDLIAGLLQ
jgi:hypothetical protein